MNEEDETITVDTNNILFWKWLTLILALIIFLAISWWAYTNTEHYNSEHFCENLEQKMQENKQLWKHLCVSQTVEGINITNLIPKEEQNWTNQKE